MNTHVLSFQNMFYVYRSLIFFLFIFLRLSFGDDAVSSNFISQPCTDILFTFPSMESMKCLQLVPKIDQHGNNYTTKNVFLQKQGICYDVLTIESSTVLLPHVCLEVCIAEYNNLFDDKSNVSIYNIFYSSASPFPSISYSSFMSYDYKLFDQCSASKKNEQILLIVVYVLSGIIGVLTLAVILKYIISWRLRKKPTYQPYNARWLVDALLCRLHKDNQSTTEQERHVTETMNFEKLNRDQPEENLAFPSNQFDLSSQSYMGSSTDPSRIPNSSTDSTADDSIPTRSEQLELPILSNPLRSTYIDVTTSNMSEITDLSGASTLNTISTLPPVIYPDNQSNLQSKSSEQTNYF